VPLAVFPVQPFLVSVTVYVPAAVGKIVSSPAVPDGMPGPVQTTVSPVWKPVAVNDGVVAHAPVPAAVIDTVGGAWTITVVSHGLSVQPVQEITTCNVYEPSDVTVSAVTFTVDDPVPVVVND
jgi:hypothetical protein